MNERITTVENMSMIEDSDNRVGQTNTRVGENYRTQEDQSQGRAVTGFHDDTTEQKLNIH